MRLKWIFDDIGLIGGIVDAMQASVSYGATTRHARIMFPHMYPYD